MKIDVKVGAAALGLATLCASWFFYQKSQQVDRIMAVASSRDPVATGTGGMVVTVDPAGKVIPGVLPPPSSLPPTTQEQNAASTSSDGLVQAPLPGGGFTMDLQGRFQNPLVATVGADGKVTMQHMHDAPHAAK